MFKKKKMEYRVRTYSPHLAKNNLKLKYIFYLRIGTGRKTKKKQECKFFLPPPHNKQNNLVILKVSRPNIKK